MQSAKSRVLRKLRVTHRFGQQGGEEGDGMSQEEYLGKKVGGYSSPKITLTKTMTYLKRTEKSYGGVACPPEKKTVWGIPNQLHCGM